MIGTMIPITPGHPSRTIKIIAIPIKAKGKVNEAKNMGILSSIILKSFESILTTLEVYEFFSVN